MRCFGLGLGPGLGHDSRPEPLAGHPLTVTVCAWRGRSGKGGDHGYKQARRAKVSGRWRTI